MGLKTAIDAGAFEKGKIIALLVGRDSADYDVLLTDGAGCLNIIGKAGAQATLLASAERSANGNGDDVDVSSPRHAAFYLDVTAAASAADDTLDVVIEAKHPGTARYTTIATFTQVLGNGGTTGERELLAAGDVLLDNTIRVKYTITAGAGTHKFTFAVYAVLK